MALTRVEEFGERLIAHREKTPYAEIDLLFGSTTRRDRMLTLVEVKTWNPALGDIWGENAISRRQWQRLSRARHFIEINRECEVRQILAIVTQNQIHFYDADSIWSR